MQKINHLAISICATTALLIPLSAQETANLEIITVSAQKSEENIQDVPINITMFDTVDITDKNIENVSDLGAYTPNLLMFSYGGDRQIVPSLRGIFSDIEARTVPAGVYIDGVPILDGWAMNESLDDIERIEVLKGPQGTLYGKNTETGVINIYTTQPSNESIRQLGLTIGSDQKKKLSLKLSGPIVEDKFFAALSVKHDEKEGFIKDKDTGKRIDDRAQNAAKLTLRATPNENLEISLINSYLKFDDGGQRISYINQTQRDIATDIDNFDKSKVMNSALKIKYDINPNSFIESVTTRRYIENDTAIDWDFTNDPQNPWTFHIYSDETIESLAQELRYNHVFLEDRLNILLGLYADTKEDKFYYTQETAGGITEKKIDLDDNSVGLFTHVTYKINPNLTFMTGLRYDKEKKEYQQKSKDIDTSESYTELSPKISLQYKVDEHKMFYSTISKGYRAGGFNYLAPNNHENIAFDKETLWSYEVGAKLMLLENLNINTSIYFMDIDNMQVSNSVSPTEEYIANVAKAHSTGLEIEAQLQMTDTLTSFVALGLNETKFDKFQDDKKDYKDNTNPFAPKYNYNLGVQYRDMQGYYGRVDANGYGKMYFDKENNHVKKAYTLVNAKVGYERENYDIYLRVQNIFDKNHDSKGYYGGNYTIYEEPREISLTMTYRF